ncbi:hypothetical protein KCU73_g5898, partial [Aureobasidium melanogenum]
MSEQVQVQVYIAEVQDICNHLEREPNFDLLQCDTKAMRAWIEAMDTGLSKSSVHNKAPHCLKELRKRTNWSKEDHESLLADAFIRDPVVTRQWQKRFVTVDQKPDSTPETVLANKQARRKAAKARRSEKKKADKAEKERASKKAHKKANKKAQREVEEPEVQAQAIESDGEDSGHESLIFPTAGSMREELGKMDLLERFIDGMSSEDLRLMLNLGPEEVRRRLLDNQVSAPTTKGTKRKRADSGLVPEGRVPKESSGSSSDDSEVNKEAQEKAAKKAKKAN